MKPTVGSLFAGIGGFDLGFERAGFETVWQVEINDWCRRVLAKNFPRAERYADIRECGVHNLKRVDVICGGFPCQDISNAGLRAGIEGERSGLWGEMYRLIGELRPRFVLVENVAALLGRGMGRVLGDLAAIGYDAEWEIVSAADVGAPHLRERVWILAYATVERRTELRVHSDGLNGEAGSERQSPAFGVCARDGAPSDTHGGRAHDEPLGLAERTAATDAGRHGSLWPVADAASARCGEARELRYEQPAQRSAGCSEELADAGGAGCEELDAAAVAAGARHGAGSAAASGGAEWWAVEPSVGRVAHGVPARVDRLRGLGNAVVPQIPELYARKLYPLVMAGRMAA